MTLTLKELKSVTNAAKNLQREIRKLRDGGEDKKTEAIELRAIKLIERLDLAAASAVQPGQGQSDELIAILKAEQSALKAHLKSRPPFPERVQTRAQLQDIQFKLGALQIGRTLTWDKLMSAADLADYRADLKQAAGDVRRRRKLQSVVSSIFNVGIMAINLTTRIATLAT